MNKTIQEVSKETLRIEEFLSKKNFGEVVYYDEIQRGANVIMDVKGKAYMRTALKRLNYEYLCIHGKGIEIVDEKTATTAIAYKAVKVDNSVKRAEKTTKNVSSKFYEKLNNEEKKHVNFMASMFGAIRAYSGQAKRLFSNRSVSNASRETIDIGKY